MLAAVHRARRRAAGHEAVCVSHQLPIWTLRRYLDQRRLWHDPRRRQCAVASLTSLVFAGDVLAEVVYCQPAVSGV
jgi:broad specificity phosphatase PhoE